MTRIAGLLTGLLVITVGILGSGVIGTPVW